MRVHPAAVRGDGSDDLMPVFVPRDVSDELASALTPGCFVLLVGESTAGKTRAAYEAIRALPGSWRLIEPMGVQAVDTAARVAQQARWPCVVWLDDLERFLGTGGLTRAHLQALRHGRIRDHCVVATMRAEEYARITRAGSSNAGPAQAHQQGQDVLALARQVRLPRRWSPAEVDRVGAFAVNDPRLREAVSHAETFGIAEYLAAGPQLLHDWQDAWAPGAHPRGAALVAAAVLARRCGIHRPLPEPVLSRAAKPFLAARGGTLLRPEPLAEALAWATAPLQATSSLLQPRDGGYLVFDYLIDAVPKAAPPLTALEALITVATLDEVVDLGDLAWGWRLHDQMEQAFRRALEHPKPEQRDRALDMLTYLVDVRYGPDRAMEFAAEMVRERTERLGAQHPDTLAARLGQVWPIGEHDRAGALSICQALLPLVEQAAGSDAWRTLIVRRTIAGYHADLGHWDAAAREYQALADAWSRIDGPNSQWAFSCRFLHADLLGKAQGPAMAIHALRALLGSLDKSVDPGFCRSAQSYLAHWLERAGLYSEAAAMWRARLADIELREGGGHVESMYVRCDVARCLGHDGDPHAAVRTIEEVLRALGGEGQEPTDRYTLEIHRKLATWIGMAGNPEQAAMRMRELAVLSARRGGDNDPLTLGCRSRAANWTAASGDIDRGIAGLESVLPLLEDALGPGADETRTCKEQVEYWREIARASAAANSHQNSTSVPTSRESDTEGPRTVHPSL